MNGSRIDWGQTSFDPACDSASDVSEGDFIELRQQAAGSGCTAEGPWRLTPLQLKTSAASGRGHLSSFSNGLFSPDDRPLPQEADPPAGCSSEASSAMERQAMPMFAPQGAERDAQPSEALLAELQARIAVLETQSTSQQALPAADASATSATSPATLPLGALMTLVAELDRSLSDIQQACHDELSPGADIEARLVQLRGLLHQRAEAGATLAAENGDEAGLHAEMARLANRITSEMSEVREFVATEVSDVCEFVEERIEEALEQQQQQQASPAQQQSGAQQAGGGRLAISTVPNMSWSPSCGGVGAWSPGSSPGGGGSLALAEVPRNVQELWSYMQQGMRRVEGLRGHTEEHLAAVRSLCAFADDRIADINQLHDRFEERIEDLHASHREMERKLARLHSEQARSAGQVQALSAVTVAGLPRKLPAAPSSASSNGDGDSTANLQRMHSAAERVHSAYAWTRPLVNLGVLMAIAALLAAVAFSNEPYVAAT